MKRRTELKLESMKIFSRKYIFNSRFLVRNTLTVLAIGTIVGGSVMAADIVGSDELADNSAKISAVFDKKASKPEEVVEVETTTEEYVINLSDSAVIAEASVDELYTKFSDEGFLVAANKTNNLNKSEYDMTGKYIVKADGLNLRDEASESSEVLGVLNIGDSGKVEGTEGDWTIVSSGDAKGYVKTQYIITDDDATKIAKQAALKGVSYRALLDVDDDQPVLVASADDDTEEPTTNTTSETETEEPTSEEDTQVTTEAPTEDTTEKVTTEEPTTEEPTTEEPTTEEPTTEEPTTEEPTTEEPTEEPTEAPAPAATSDVNLLAAIVYAESGGECYEGQLAVASVVMNRLANGYWGSTLSDVIYAPNQFEGIYCSTFTSTVNGGAPDSCVRAAQEALSGVNNIGSCMYFLPTWAVDTSSLGSYRQIGNHVFW
ncbi:MAG: cell wall hydrolase [Eubacterium sp.]|nr:cell wall hydrolase [Eubacterium sp.]